MECLWLKLAESNRVAGEDLALLHNGYPFWIQVPIGGQTAEWLRCHQRTLLSPAESSNMQFHDHGVGPIHEHRTDS